MNYQDDYVKELKFHGKNLDPVKWRAATGIYKRIAPECIQMSIENQTDNRIELSWDPDKKKRAHKIKEVCEPHETLHISFELFPGGRWGEVNALYLRGKESTESVILRFY